MILSKTVEIEMSHNKYKKMYEALGYDVHTSNTINVSIVHLPINSHVKVHVRCDICKKEKWIGYNKYNKNIEKYNLYTCDNTCAQIKNKKTSIKKFGCDHFSKTSKHKKRVSHTSSGIRENLWEKRTCVFCNSSFTVRKKQNKKFCSVNCLVLYCKSEEGKKEMFERTQAAVLNKYGVKNVWQHPAIIEKIRNTRIERNLEIPFDQLSAWQQYNRIVRKLTLRNRKKLFEQWDGYDYYDKQYIKCYMSHKYTCNEYPTVDHKISVHYGFIHNMPPEQISDIENLCITKRVINSIKRIRTELQFTDNT